MEKAGIKDPESQEGIDFCINDCPFPDCLITGGSSHIKKAERDERIKQMFYNGMKVNEIAQEVGTHERTVQRALAGNALRATKRQIQAGNQAFV